MSLGIALLDVLRRVDPLESLRESISTDDPCHVLLIAWEAEAVARDPHIGLTLPPDRSEK